MNFEMSAPSQPGSTEAIGGMTRPLRVQLVGGLEHHAEPRNAPQSAIYDFAVQVAMTATAALVVGSFAYLLRTKVQDNTCPTAGLDRIAKVLKKKGHKPEIVKVLNEHELHVLGDVVDPEHLITKFEDIGGLKRQKQMIFDSIIAPLMLPEGVRAGEFDRQPTGMLLSGPPGCGKTMIAKAIAAESRAMFIDLKISTLMSKWHGESQKRCNAVFTVGRKLSPCIVFIDEIEIFLRDRGQDNLHPESDSLRILKQIFLSQWDGLQAEEHESISTRGQLMIMGATNRPEDIDRAFLRRFESKHKIHLPDCGERVEILRLMFEKFKRGVKRADAVARDIAERTEGFSGSDLKSLCKDASFQHRRRERDEGARSKVNINDFLDALQDRAPRP
eukprot:g4361.t1